MPLLLTFLYPSILVYVYIYKFNTDSDVFTKALVVYQNLMTYSKNTGRICAACIWWSTTRDELASIVQHNTWIQKKSPRVDNPLTHLPEIKHIKCRSAASVFLISHIFHADVLHRHHTISNAAFQPTTIQCARF